jgi:ferredoxin-NADP reductase
VLLVGGGTGIAPLRSMWRELLAHDEGSRLSVIYSVRSSEELAFLPELEALHRRGRIGLAVTVTGSDLKWEGGRGRLTDEALVTHVTAPAQARCAVCGPSTFVAHVVEILRRLGVPPRHIATERW